MKIISLVSIAMLAACGGGGKSPAIDSATQHDAPVHDAAKVFLDAPPGTFPLTVKNVISWCSVTVNGGPATTSSSIVTNVLPGPITLTATPIPNFEIGPTPWHLVDGDTGGGVQGTLSGSMTTATVTVGSAAKCVWVCCRSQTDTTDCDVPDQCP